MPRRIFTALLVTLSCALAGPAAAHADGPVDPQGPDVQAALQIAEQHWGATPCGGTETIAWVASADSTLNATATWRNPTDAWLNPLLNSDCVVALNPNTSWDWPKLCSVVAHELGHLLGHPHVADPADLMYPVYTHPIPECTAQPEPEGTLTAAVTAAQAVAAQAQAAQTAAQVAADVAAAQAAAAAQPVAIPDATTSGDDDAGADTAGAAVRTAAASASPAAARAAAASVRATRVLQAKRCVKRADRKHGRARSAARASCRRLTHSHAALRSAASHDDAGVHGTLGFPFLA